MEERIWFDGELIEGEVPKVKGECGVQHTVPRCYRLVWKAIHPAHKKSVRACVRVCLLIMCVVVSVSTCVFVCARVRLW